MWIVFFFFFFFFRFLGVEFLFGFDFFFVLFLGFLGVDLSGLRGNVCFVGFWGVLLLAFLCGLCVFLA